MKKILFVLAMVFACFISNGQDLENECNNIKAKINSLPHKYTIKGSMVEFQEIFELNPTLTKDMIYNIVKNYVISSYGDANSVIQTDDKDGGRIVVKGLYGDLYCDCSNFVFGGSAMEYTATHIIQFDIKDGRMRVTLDITQVKQKSGGTGYGTAYYTPLKYIDFSPTQFYPFKTDCDVYSGNHQMNWYPREKSQRQYKGLIHEGGVMYNIMLRANATIENIHNTCTNDVNVDRISDDW